MRLVFRLDEGRGRRCSRMLMFLVSCFFALLPVPYVLSFLVSLLISQRILRFSVGAEEVDQALSLLSKNG